MPHFISIAVESPAHYVALDSQSNTWRGHFVTEPGAFPRDHGGARQFEVPGAARHRGPAWAEGEVRSINHGD
jgi:hypothetical protein